MLRSLLLLSLLSSCMAYESLPTMALQGIVLNQLGSELTLRDGRQIHVDVIYGMRVQGFGEAALDPDTGVCGEWQPLRQRIVIAQVATCGDLYSTLLHELGHAYGLPHGHGIMWHGFVGPVSKEDLADYMAALP